MAKSSKRSALKHPPMGPIHGYLTLPVVAERIGCSPKTAKRLILKGPLLGSYFGTRLKVWSAHLDQFLAQQKTAGAP